VVECTGLEIRRTFRRTVSSNLTLSASKTEKGSRREPFFVYRLARLTHSGKIENPLDG
jgi:hypothetical protein